VGNEGKIMTYEFEWAFSYQFFAVGSQLNWISHIFWFKLLKPFFCEKSKLSLKYKIKYQQFNKRKIFRLIPLSTPVDLRWTIPNMSNFTHFNGKRRNAPMLT
jgi:hypothetical protein